MQGCPQLTSLQIADSYLEHTVNNLLKPLQHKQLITSIRCLVNYKLVIANLTPLIVDALMDYHANWLDTISLYVAGGSWQHFLLAGRLLRLPNLTEFSMSDCRYGWPVEDALALLKTAWDCPKLKRLSLDGFENFYGFDDDEPDETGYVLSAPAPLGDDHVDGDDNQEQTNGDQVANSSPPQPETILVQVASDQAFSEALARNGWAIDLSAPHSEGERWEWILGQEAGIDSVLIELLADEQRGRNSYSFMLCRL